MLFTLVPKKDKYVDHSGFQHIIMCNVIYKMMTKIIANHLKLILPWLISVEQIGVVEGHQSLDGIMISHETIHTLQSSKNLNMFLKLDLSYEFDKINLTYYLSILHTFNFEPH